MSNHRYQLIIRNSMCVNEDCQFEADIAVDDGIITKIEQNLDASAHIELDASDAFVLPGVIDAHVHLPWPSASYDSADDFYTGTQAAACGGVTTIIEYVVPDFSDDLLPSFETHQSQAHNFAFVDYGFHMILRKVTKKTHSQMEEMIRRGVSSFKIFTAYDGFQLSDSEILVALHNAVDLNALVCFHAESGDIVNFATEQLAEVSKTGIEYYSEAHPPEADYEALQRVLTFAEYTGARIHIAHVNTKYGVDLISTAQQRGVSVTAETCPHYLMFAEDVYKSGKPEAANYVLAPAIRSKEDCGGLWKAISDDGLQSIATDHCPYTTNQKQKNGNDFRLVPGGAAGVETSLSLLYTYGVCENKISIEQLVKLTSSNPARIFNIYPEKGVIAVGSQADLVIFDVNESDTIKSSKLHSATDHTLYEDIEILGKPRFTILRGEVIAQEGNLYSDKPTGSFIFRKTY